MILRLNAILRHIWLWENMHYSTVYYRYLGPWFISWAIVHLMIARIFDLQWQCGANITRSIFFKSSQRHLIARPRGRGMGCILWVKLLMCILPQLPKWCMQYHVIFDSVITSLKYIIFVKSKLWFTSNCFRLDHETTVCAKLLLCSYGYLIDETYKTIAKMTKFSEI